MDKRTLSVARIVKSTSSDGPGLRNSLYLAGCQIRCKGCHNKHLWDIGSGEPMSVERVCRDLNEDEFDISILGGEPMLQYENVVALCKMIRERHPKKTIWLWTGFVMEYVEKHYPDILPCIDVLVDGPYIESLAEPNLQWRGSSNQRILNVRDRQK